MASEQFFVVYHNPLCTLESKDFSSTRTTTDENILFSECSKTVWARFQGNEQRINVTKARSYMDYK